MISRFAVLILMFSVVDIVTYNVYYVIPDDGECDGVSSHHCDNLQNYLLNISKYFSANTQLIFLPGLHHLPTNLSIQDVHNISLIGNMADGVVSTIQCSAKQLFIIMTNITQLNLKDMTITGCGASIQYAMLYFYGLHTLQLHYCSDVTVENITILSRTIYDSLISVNNLGILKFYNITSAGITLVYNDNNTITQKLLYPTFVTLIDNFQYTCALECPPSNKITIKLNQTWFNVQVIITNINLCFQYYTNSIGIFMTSESHNIIQINHCFCSGKVIAHFYETVFEIKGDNSIDNSNSTVQIKNCHFTDIFYDKFGLLVFKIISSFATINIISCTFINISSCSILDADWLPNNGVILIKNTSFLSISSQYSLIHLINWLLLLEGPVLFNGVKITGNGSLFNVLYGCVCIYDYVEISNCIAETILPNDAVYFTLKQAATVNFTGNRIVSFTNLIFEKEQLPCAFQFLSDNNLDYEFTEGDTKLNFSIVFNANHWVIPLDSSNLKINHCTWLSSSAFNTTLPFDVNRRMITFINDSFTVVNKSLCYCSNRDEVDCLVDELGPIYPGQTMNIKLAYPTGHHFTLLYVDVYDIVMPVTACKMSLLQDANQFVGQSCTELNFTIAQTNDHYRWCELNFKWPFLPNDGYYIKFYPCPAGFVKLDGKCQCDPILISSTIIIDSCDINDQTIKRPVNSWISAVTNNDDSHTYFVSLNCPFDYCLPHSLRLKLSSSDLQCQHKRSKLLCGQCSDGLSTVFGSSHCQQCSNVNLFIILPVALSGIVLVVLLFCLNLTVADGTINAFILYINIVSINSTVLFPSHNTSTATGVAYAFISLANLDMGIEMCFYNGMDGYAKMWLQLLFPLYLVLIAATLIVGSRYSARIQRLTAQRALPVLATLFILSYTKILLTVSSVLFSYSTIIQLPSDHATLVWSVDANVNVLEFKFIALFIACLIIFLLLIPFNITLLFTRTLSRFRMISYFKPMLDVYQAPYRDGFYYWTGLHLVTKTVFFGISALDDNKSLTIGIILLCVMEGVVGYSCPFKHRLKNLQEIILLLNLNALFVFTLSGQSIVAVDTMVALAAVHFSFIIIYHVINYTTCGAAFKNRMQVFMSLLLKEITKKLSRTKSSNNSVAYRNEIPEVTYNYSIYQEPLVGEDYM